MDRITRERYVAETMLEGMLERMAEERAAAGIKTTDERALEDFAERRLAVAFDAGRCPFCDRELVKLELEAPATIVTAALVVAELEPHDFTTHNQKHDYRGVRRLHDFRLDERVEWLDDDTGHFDLELDDPRAEIRCRECQAELGRRGLAAFEDRAARIAAKVAGTDDAIASRRVS
jgi:uncharacterized protein with PIN domain